uniref:Uncharacterized protein n=1 Tax=uncultured marine bacterium TaxID=56765 RepID=A0A8D6BL86_9BACT|nr:hypothetical protein [uncultured marine bacterium]
MHSWLPARGTRPLRPCVALRLPSTTARSCGVCSGEVELDRAVGSGCSCRRHQRPDRRIMACIRRVDRYPSASGRRPLRRPARTMATRFLMPRLLPERLPPSCGRRMSTTTVTLRSTIPWRRCRPWVARPASVRKQRWWRSPGASARPAPRS